MELTINQALQKAVEAQKAGRVQEADRFYTAIIKAHPKHPDANHNMGVLAVGVGKVEIALPFLKTALEANPNIAQFWLSYIDALIKLDRLKDAKAVLDQAKNKGAKGDGFDKLDQRLQKAGQVPLEANRIALEPKPEQDNAKQNPPQEIINQLIDLLNHGHMAAVIEQTLSVIEQYPDAFAVWNILGTANKGLGRMQLATEAFRKVIEINPTYSYGFSNLGVTLQEQGKLEEAIEAYDKALAIKPNNAEAYNNMGNAVRAQGKLKEAIEAYNKALTIKPDYAEAYDNMGIALKAQGKLEEAIEAYNKALAIKPNNAETYNNMGIALQEQGKWEEAIEAYKKALDIKPDYANAHRNLSLLTQYNSSTAQINEVLALLSRKDLSDQDRCNLFYTNAKMQEDLGDFRSAFDSYVAGGDLRKKLLGYEYTQDEILFAQIKKTAPHFKDVVLNATKALVRHTPIFILGMPRSGTTLVEQIISSHSEVAGAGELDFVRRFGNTLATGLTFPNLKEVSTFRKNYLTELKKRADDHAFVTDKMPHNFRYIALICAALPEAKIIHTQRNSKATCWSNFKHFFVSKDLGYSFDLSDTVKYYGLYKNLMNFWYQNYNDCIYNLDYDKLTEDQEPETRRLIEYLGLKWEDTCLAPQENRRFVGTASTQQVRQKVYTGSSQAWRKYELFLDGIFDQL